MLKRTIGSLALVFATQAMAHDVMIIPSKSTITKAPSAVAIDITATHGLYRVDRGVSTDAISVTAPDGKNVRNIGTVVKGATRTSFELPITEEGTYKVQYGNATPGYMTTYTIGERDTRKRLRANKSESAAQIPEGAKNIETTMMSRQAVTYLTSKAPTNAALEPTNTGFELIPVTHPADYINGETLEFKTLLDGKPVEGVQFAFHLESSQYTENQKPIELKTNKDGIVSHEFEQAGRYFAKITMEADSTDPEADKVRATVFYTFEVVYE